MLPTSAIEPIVNTDVPRHFVVAAPRSKAPETGKGVSFSVLVAYCGVPIHLPSFLPDESEALLLKFQVLTRPGTRCSS